MSIDHFHFVKGEAITELKTDEEIEAKKRDHTIYVMWGGIEHVYIFGDTDRRNVRAVAEGAVRGDQADAGWHQATWR